MTHNLETTKLSISVKLSIIDALMMQYSQNMDQFLKEINRFKGMTASSNHQPSPQIAKLIEQNSTSLQAHTKLYLNYLNLSNEIKRYMQDLSTITSADCITKEIHDRHLSNFEKALDDLLKGKHEGLSKLNFNLRNDLKSRTLSGALFVINALSFLCISVPIIITASSVLLSVLMTFVVIPVLASLATYLGFKLYQYGCATNESKVEELTSVPDFKLFDIELAYRVASDMPKQDQEKFTAPDSPNQPHHQGANGATTDAIMESWFTGNHSQSTGNNPHTFYHSSAARSTPTPSVDVAPCTR